MATIAEVAKKAGVSVATVSRVLNNSISVKSDTADRVKRQSRNWIMSQICPRGICGATRAGLF